MTRTHVFIEWNARLTHGVQLIDDQHEKLVHLTNTLHLACLQDKETAMRCFVEVAREAVNYVHYHFTTEEHMMRFLMYPNYYAHRKEHELFIKEILRQTQRFAEHKSLVPNRFVQFLKDWILSHIAVCDKSLAEHILHLEDTERLQLLFTRPA
ncbi:MAG: bacteriohemerythrin [Treponema sp.]|nr:bacteriohemerythrin [Treponema sp.]